MEPAPAHSPPPGWHAPPPCRPPARPSHHQYPSITVAGTLREGQWNPTPVCRHPQAPAVMSSPPLTRAVSAAPAPSTPRPRVIRACAAPHTHTLSRPTLHNHQTFPSSGKHQRASPKMCLHMPLTPTHHLPGGTIGAHLNTLKNPKRPFHSSWCLNWPLVQDQRPPSHQLSPPSPPVPVCGHLVQVVLGGGGGEGRGDRQAYHHPGLLHL